MQSTPLIPIIDGHLDLAWNAVGLGRDPTLAAAQVRMLEQPMDRADRGAAMVTLPELRSGGVRLIIGTLFARCQPGVTPDRCLMRSSADSPTTFAAHAMAAGQLAWYRAMERHGRLRLITDAAGLDAHWRDTSIDAPLGVVVMIEGADPILEPTELGAWAAQGVRMVSLAHYGPGHYAVGTGEEGSLTRRGRELLEQMQTLGVALDVSHLSDASFEQAMAQFEGPVAATHSACRSICPRGNRQLTDRQIRQLAQRDAVVGIPIHNAMLKADYTYGESSRSDVPLRVVAEHIDHVCQLVGDAAHVAIGSDLDGGYGAERCPPELETIADLPRLAQELTGRGMSDADIAGVLHGNWLALLRRVLG